MLARVKPDYRFSTVIAFSGHEYTKKEWRKVPKGFETEANRYSSFLLLKEDSPDREQAIAEKYPTKVQVLEEASSSGYATPFTPETEAEAASEESEEESESTALKRAARRGRKKKE